MTATPPTPPPNHYGAYNVYSHYGAPAGALQTSSAVSPYGSPAPARKKKWPKILAWVGSFFGGVMIVSAPELAMSFADGIGRALIGLAMLIPSLWWFYCDHADKKAVKDWHDRVRTEAGLKSSLGDAYSVVTAGMGEVEPPRLMERRWPVVTAVSIGVLILGGLLVEPVEEAADTDETATSGSQAQD